MGIIYFVDIVNGMDGNVGNDMDAPFKTVTKAMLACVSGNNDVIYILSSGANTVVDESVVIAKDNVSIIGENQHVEIKPTLTGGPSISITGDGAKLLTLTVGVTAGGTDNAITVSNAKNATLEDLQIEDATADGIELINSDEVIIKGTAIQGSAEFGINIADSGCNNTQIHSDVLFADNTSGDLVDNGTNTLNSISVGGGGLTAAQDLKLSDIHGHVRRCVYIDTESLTDGPRGYQQAPFNNVTSGIDYAENNNLLDLIIVSNLTLDRALSNFTIEGIGGATFDLNGQAMLNTRFSNITLLGSYTGVINVTETALINLNDIQGSFVNVSVLGTLTVANAGQVIMAGVAPALAGQPWTIDMDNGGASIVSIHNSSGGIIVKNMDNAGDVLHILASQGEVTIDSSCTLGNMVVGGTVKVTDNSAGTVVNISAVVDGSVREIDKLDIAQHNWDHII